MRCEIPLDTVTTDFQLESVEAFCMLPFIESSAATLKSIKIFMIDGFKGYKLKMQDLQEFFSDYNKLEELSAVFYLSKDDLQKPLATSESLLHLDLHIIEQNAKGAEHSER
jgi:hypothetical protein